MVRVDDLIISLRIEDTGNLGDLQKQLTALVGKRGEKIDLGGLGAVTKTDLNFIKNKLMELSPAVLGTEVKALKESAKVSLRQLMKKQLQETLIAKYGLPKSEIESWMVFLSKAISERDINTAKLANFIERIHDLIFGAARIGGREKTRVTDVRKALTESFIEEQFIRALEKAGKVVRAQYQYREIDPKLVVKYEDKIDEIIKGKKGEIKELHGVEYTAEMEKKLIELSQEISDSDVFIGKALTDIMGISSVNTKILTEKLKIGVEDPILSLLAFLRVKSARDEHGITLVENLNYYIKNELKRSVAESIRKSDIKMSRDVIREIIDNAEEYGLKVTGDIEELGNQLEEVVVEIKKIFDKSVADNEIQNDKRLKELGKDFLVYFTTASTKQGRRALERWQKASGIGAKYVKIEGNIRDMAKALDAQEDLAEVMAEADVFKEYDTTVNAIDDIKNNITSLIKQVIKEDPENLRTILKELFGLEEHIKKIAQTEEEILDSVEGKVPEELTFKGTDVERDPFGGM